MLGTQCISGYVHNQRLSIIMALRIWKGDGKKCFEKQGEKVNDSAEVVVLYTDDTSIIITSLNPTNVTNSANKFSKI
jgi:hypothetical protein